MWAVHEFILSNVQFRFRDQTFKSWRVAIFGFTLVQFIPKHHLGCQVCLSLSAALFSLAFCFFLHLPSRPFGSPRSLAHCGCFSRSSCPLARDRKKKGRSRASSTTPTPASTSATSRVRSRSWSTRWASSGAARDDSAALLPLLARPAADSSFLLVFSHFSLIWLFREFFSQLFPQLVLHWHVSTTPRDFLCHTDASKVNMFWCR